MAAEDSPVAEDFWVAAEFAEELLDSAELDTALGARAAARSVVEECRSCEPVVLDLPVVGVLEVVFCVWPE